MHDHLAIQPLLHSCDAKWQSLWRCFVCFLQQQTGTHLVLCCCPDACVLQALMLAFYFSSNYVDVYIAKQQRKQLGLCERCGGLNDAATCSQDGCPMKSKAAQ
jgi:hypothetical protein